MRKEKITKYKVEDELSNRDTSTRRTLIVNCTHIKNITHDERWYEFVIDGKASPSFTFKEWQMLSMMVDEILEMQGRDRNNPNSL